ncbi:MAG: hypothetical protein BWK78_02435 [Thiotrichaceae bacterium IS1]|nr:MAG: hypothetical protein BWK78_02435 [Thiotrichaceae bacterium IS1]
MSMVIRWLGVLVWVIWAGVGVAQEVDDLDKKAIEYSQQGQFELAVQTWEEARSKLAPDSSPRQYMDISVDLAAAYQSLGRLQDALKVLQSAKSVAEKSNDSLGLANVLSQLSNIYLAMDDLGGGYENCQLISNSGKSVRQQNREKADQYLKDAQQLVQQLEDSPSKANLQAELHNQRANLYISQGNYKDALKSYSEGMTSAIDDLLKTQISVNLALVSVDFALSKVDTWKDEEIAQLDFPGKIQDALQQVKALSTTPHWHDEIFGLVGLVRAIWKMGDEPTLSKELLKLRDSKQQLRKAIEDAVKKVESQANDNLLKGVDMQKDKNALAYAKSSLADLQEENCDSISIIADKQQCFSSVIKNIEEVFEYDAKSYPRLLLENKTHEGVSRKWITNADSFVSQEVNMYLSSSANETAETQGCKEICKNYSSPCSATGIPERCKEVCKTLSPPFLRDYQPEVLFRLQWQLGQIYTKQYHQAGPDTKTQKQFLDTAIKAYDRATDYLGWVRRNYRSISKPFGEAVEKFLSEKSDLLLHAARFAKNERNVLLEQEFLNKAIEEVELLNKTELQNYWQDSCVTEKTPKQQESTTPDCQDKVAFLYIFLFDDRVELLLTTASQTGVRTRLIGSFIAEKNSNPEFSRKKVREQAKKFVKAIHNDFRWEKKKYRECKERTKTERTKNEQRPKHLECLQTIHPDFDYVSPAISLYNTFFRATAVEDTLKALNIETLVIVPSDSSLFKVPFSALYDGNKYLAENYAVVVTYSARASLRAITSAMTQNNRVMANGLTSKVPELQEQLSQISMMFPISNILRDSDFSKMNVEKRFNEIQKPPYSIIHFATHGYFDNIPDRIYLDSYDGEIWIDLLECFIEKTTSLNQRPVEMLVLSACNSASSGNDGAILGLAGVGVKAGTLSALGTLWRVEVNATNKLITSFYQSLATHSPARSLQLAQQSLIETFNRKHCKPENQRKDDCEISDPYFWAGFLLIGGPE